MGKDMLDIVDIIATVASILTILSFMGSFYYLTLKNTKIKEMRNTIESIYKIGVRALWEEKMLVAEDAHYRLIQAGKTTTSVNDLVQLASQYVGNKHKYESSTELEILAHKGIIWTNAMINEIEVSENTKETWIVTPDLEPDLSDESTGRVVNHCVKKGKKYVFFLPNNLLRIEDKINKLFNNIDPSGKDKIRECNNVTFIQLDPEKYKEMFNGGNTVLFFSDSECNLTPRCFNEVCLEMVEERGVFWQQYTDKKADEIKYSLQENIINHS